MQTNTFYLWLRLRNKKNSLDINNLYIIMPKKNLLRFVLMLIKIVD